MKDVCDRVMYGGGDVKIHQRLKQSLGWRALETLRDEDKSVPQNISWKKNYPLTCLMTYSQMTKVLW